MQTDSLIYSLLCVTVYVIEDPDSSMNVELPEELSDSKSRTWRVICDMHVFHNSLLCHVCWVKCGIYGDITSLIYNLPGLLKCAVMYNPERSRS